MGLFRKTEEYRPPTEHYLVVRVMHPQLKATGGYLKTGYVDYKWTKNWMSASRFRSQQHAEACVKGFGIQHQYYYKIIRL